MVEPNLNDHRNMINKKSVYEIIRERVAGITAEFREYFLFTNSWTTLFKPETNLCIIMSESTKVGYFKHFAFDLCKSTREITKSQLTGLGEFISLK